MDSFLLQNSFHRNMSSINDDTHMAPDLSPSHGLDDTLSSVSLSPTMELSNTFLAI